MDLDVVFLGTSGSAPTARRAPSALLIRRGGDRLLFDCGEGTQRQLLRSSIGLVDLHEIFVTHFHADHYLGLPGMLKTFALRGPRGAADDLRAAGPPRAVRLARPRLRQAHVPLELVEVRPGDALRRDGYQVLVFPVEHGATAVGYALVEETRPGRFDAGQPTRSGSPRARSAAPCSGARQ